jgi:hypothetical protein
VKVCEPQLSILSLEGLVDASVAVAKGGSSHDRHHPLAFGRMNNGRATRVNRHGTRKTSIKQFK